MNQGKGAKDPFEQEEPGNAAVLRAHGVLVIVRNMNGKNLFSKDETVARIRLPGGLSAAESGKKNCSAMDEQTTEI